MVVCMYLMHVCNVCMYVCMYVFICVCVHVPNAMQCMDVMYVMYVCLYVSICVCMYACMWCEYAIDIYIYM